MLTLIARYPWGTYLVLACLWALFVLYLARKHPAGTNVSELPLPVDDHHTEGEYSPSGPNSPAMHAEGSAFNMFVSGGNVTISPQPSVLPSSPIDGGKPQSSASLHLSDISVYSENALIEAGKRLAFRVTFENKGPIGIREGRLSVAMAVTWDIPSDATIREMWDRIRAVVRTESSNPSIQGTPVGIGNGIYREIMGPPLEQLQADGLIKGTARVYLFNWVGWIGDDGLKGEREVGVYMRKPHSKIIQGEEMKHWDTVLVPPKESPLW